MIIGVIGNRGTGKTLFMTLEAFNQYRKQKTIYSNYELTFPKIDKCKKPILIPDDFFLNYEKFNLTNVCLFFDEIYIYIDSRTSGSKSNRVMSYFFNQTRKTGVDLYYSTQFFSQVDKRLRFNTEVFVIPKAIKDKNKNLFILVEICNRDLKLLDKWLIRAKPIFNLYNTDEIISMFDSSEVNLPSTIYTP